MFEAEPAPLAGIRHESVASSRREQRAEADFGEIGLHGSGTVIFSRTNNLLKFPPLGLPLMARGILPYLYSIDFEPCRIPRATPTSGVGCFSTDCEVARSRFRIRLRAAYLPRDQAAAQPSDLLTSQRHRGTLPWIFK